MSDLAIQSCESSGLINVLTESKVQNLSYAIKSSFPILVPQTREIQPQQAISGSPHGRETVFYLNRSQMLKNLLLKVQFTKAGGTVVLTNKIGLQVAEWIEIRSNGKTITRLSSAAIRALVAVMGEEAKMAVQRRALPLVPATGVLSGASDTSFLTYCPIFSHWFDQAESSLDLGFVEQISVVVRWASAGTVMGLDSDMTSISPTLFVWNWQSDSAYNDYLRSQNFKAGSFLNQLGWNTYTESFTATNGATTHNVRLRNNYPVKAIHYALLTSGGVLKRIDSSTLRFGGISLCESINRLELNYDKELQGCSANEMTSITAVARQDKEFVSIPLSLDVKNRTYNSGCTSFNDLNSVELTITHESASTGDNIVVVVEYLQFVSINENGIISVSQSY